MKLEDVYRGEHFQFRGGLYRKLENGGSIMVDHMLPNFPDYPLLNDDTEVTRVNPLKWRELYVGTKTVSEGDKGE